MRTITSILVLLVCVALSSTLSGVNGAPSNFGVSSSRVTSAHDTSHTHHHGRLPTRTYDARQEISPTNMNIDDNTGDVTNTSSKTSPILNDARNQTLPVNANATVNDTPVTPAHTPATDPEAKCDAENMLDRVKCYNQSM